MIVDTPASTRSCVRTSPSSSESIPTARIALLGCGVVGREVARVLLEDCQRIATETGVHLNLVAVLVRNLDRDRAIDRSLLVRSFDAVLERRPDVVIEVLGGVQPAAQFIEAALDHGIGVVTANKSVIARHGRHLRHVARRRRVTLAYEAAVGAAVPAIAAMRQRGGDSLRSIQAVVSGSCNFILTRMVQERCDLQTALAKAIARGLAEPDPSADLSGSDTVEKLCILAAEAGLPEVSPDEVPVHGIAAITLHDHDAARAHGCVIKLLGQLFVSEVSACLRVGPMLIPRRHPLAQVDGQENALLIEHALAGPLLVVGRGAGPKPTTSAILGDILRVLDTPVERMASADTNVAIEFSAEGCWRGDDDNGEYFVRMSSDNTADLSPQTVFNTLRASAIKVQHIELRTGSFAAVLRAGDAHLIADACQRLSCGRSEGPLIAPMLTTTCRW